MAAAPQDITAKTSEKTLLVDWGRAHVSAYGFKYLRCHCGCAGCVDEGTGVRVLDPDSVAQDIAIADMGLVGNYAVQFTWSDGHDTGIYSWDYLLQVCPCEACGGPTPFERRPSPGG